LAFGQGRIDELAPDRERARRSYSEAVALARQVQSADSPAYLAALARVVDSKDEALDLRREAVEFARQHWGPHHPRTAQPTFELGLALLEAGLGGEDELETAREIWIEVHQRPHPKLARAYLLLAREALNHGALDEAEARARSMAANQDQVLLENDPARGEPEQLLAIVESIRGNHESALDHANAALAWFELAGPDDPGAWSMRELVVDKLLALGRLDDAERELESMLAAKPSDPERVESIHLQLADLAVRRNLLEEADLQLRSVATLDPDEHSFVYEFLRALVDLRLGRLELAQIERVQAAPPRFTPDQLSEWFEELALTSSERRRLALPD
jgi:tetratricopeptide (TPR) repeat protein